MACGPCLLDLINSTPPKPHPSRAAMWAHLRRSCDQELIEAVIGSSQRPTVKGSADLMLA
jgi:hypothetical protein